MFTKLRRRAKHRVAALLFVVTAGTVLFQPAPAHAVISFPPPPGCHTDIRPIEWKPGAFAFYEFAFEYRGRRLGVAPVPYARGTYIYERIFVYQVSNMIYPYGLVPAGRAEKVCGTVIYQG